jgi:hypothetical protein
MKNNLRTFISSLTLFLLLYSFSNNLSAVTPDELRNAQNTAGYLVTLSNRMSRLYMRYRYQASTISNRDELYEAVDVFDESLNILEHGSLVDIVPEPPNQAVINQINEVRKLWEPLRKIYATQKTTTFTESDIVIPRSRSRDTVLLSYLEKSNENLAETTRGIVQTYEAYCEEQKMEVRCFPLVGTVGQMRERSERIAKYIMLISLNLDKETYTAKLEDARDDFLERVALLKDQSKEVEDNVWAGPIIQTIEAYWQQYQIYVNEALDGSPQNIRHDSMDRTYRNLIAELDNYVLNVLSLTQY